MCGTTGGWWRGSPTQLNSAVFAMHVHITSIEDWRYNVTAWQAVYKRKK